MQEALSKNSNRSGFTLIELSIVLVIIGLIVGGVLVGQDLIRAAGVRAQISQIEKFNTAVNTFYGKYQALPGDMNGTTATVNGFNTSGRDTGGGTGDGNGLIEGNGGSNGGGGIQGDGETGMFWSDLTYANGMNLNLVEGSFTTACEGLCTHIIVMISTTPNIDNYLPRAKIGRGNYIYALSTLGLNYYALTTLIWIHGTSGGQVPVNATPGLTVNEAYKIDSKIDDGFPQSGNVTAQMQSGYWGESGSASTAMPWVGTADTSATSPGDTTCYDNGGVTAPQHYSTAWKNGNGLNCALLFKFQ